MIVINNRELEYRLWLKHRNLKNLKRRTKKKAAIKRSRTLKNQYNRSLKKIITYDNGNNHFKFKAPLRFSFILNPNETISFFNDIINFITDKRNFGKKIFIDISEIQELTIDALMYLLAIVTNMNDKFNKYRFSGNAPLNERVRNIFDESGFYNFVRYRGREPISSNSDAIKIVSGHNSNTGIARQIADFVIDKAGLSKVEASFIYIMMIEMMSNTHKHAYNDKDILLPQWYCFAEYDQADTISFTFMDTGSGIPSTVRKNFAERIDLLKLKGEDKYVVSALKGHFRTATEHYYRGKGLPKIKMFCDTRKIHNMKILTDKAEVAVNSNKISSKIMDNRLKGTLYYWQVSISELKGELL